MRRPKVPSRLRSSLAVLGALGCTALLVGGGPQATAATQGPQRSYLALGDSVVFGFIAGDGYAYTNPHNFLAYPAYAAHVEGMRPVNAACPGEATTGFLSATGADNGCRTFKATFPLHVSYPGETQMQFATAWLSGHHNTHLVTVSLGANDAFILETACAGNPACIASGLPAVLATVAANMNTILGNLRATGYRGVIEVVNYYSLDYSDAAGTGLTELLNGAVTGAAAAHHAVVADAFSAFQAAASTSLAGGNTCKAGLLNANANPTLPASAPPSCDVHPSQSGQQLLAHTVEETYAEATDH